MISGAIVVGVDRSPEGNAAAAVGWRLSAATGTRCQLVHATRDFRPAMDLAPTGVAADELERAQVVGVRGDLVAALETAVPDHVLAGLIIRAGPAARVLADVVNEIGADLVVLGGKHHSILGRWLSGSTVRQAVRRLHVPMFVTAGWNPLPPRPRILVAVDLSEAARPTIEHARAFAALLGGSLRALHVVEPLPVAPEVAGTIDMVRLEAQAQEQLEREVWPLLRIPEHHRVVRRGNAVDTISQEAAAWRADVVVVGSHGKGWVDRLLIGSVTEQLLDDLPASMLVVPVLTTAREREMAAWAGVSETRAAPA